MEREVRPRERKVEFAEFLAERLELFDELCLLGVGQFTLCQCGLNRFLKHADDWLALLGLGK